MVTGMGPIKGPLGVSIIGQFVIGLSHMLVMNELSCHIISSLSMHLFNPSSIT